MRVNMVFLMLHVVPLVLGVKSCAHTNPVRYNPRGLVDASRLGYSQVVVDRRSKVVYFSSQASTDQGNGTHKYPIIGSSVASQLKQAEYNVMLALKSTATPPLSVLKLVVHVVYRKEDEVAERQMEIQEAIQKLSTELGKPALSVMTVEGLRYSDLLVQVEVTALLSSAFEERVEYGKCDENGVIVESRELGVVTSE